MARRGGGFAVATLAIAVSNLGYYFYDPDRDADFSSPNSQIGNPHLNEADRLGPGTAPVYLLGAPWMSYDDFKNIEFSSRGTRRGSILSTFSTRHHNPESLALVFAVLSSSMTSLAIIQRVVPKYSSEVRHEAIRVEISLHGLHSVSRPLSFSLTPARGGLATAAMASAPHGAARQLPDSGPFPADSIEVLSQRHHRQCPGRRELAEIG